MRPFVDPEWLSDHPEAVLVDVRSYLDGRSGREAYERGHLPGAVFVDLSSVLAAAPTAELGRHPLPTPEVFAAGLSAVGIGDTDVVVAYDDDSGAMAARLVWMLRVTGHDAALLEGGYDAWHGRREQAVPARPATIFTPIPWPPGLLAESEDLDGLTVVDARPPERFRGDMEPMDARPGHVPGAVSLPCRANVGPNGRLLPIPELRRRLTPLTEGPWVSMCGSGVTACHTLLVAEHLGLPPGRLYPGSWSQWAATDRPAELGS
jgi:thiosulfate/3-mercaptopyruvate sulfurtransferase